MVDRPFNYKAFQDRFTINVVTFVTPKICSAVLKTISSPIHIFTINYVSY